MMDKYNFIAKDGKNSLIDLEIDKGVLRLHLNLKNIITQDDGNIVCVKCNERKFSKKEQNENEKKLKDGKEVEEEKNPNYCTNCGTKLEWDLKEKFDKQEKIKADYRILEDCLEVDEQTGHITYPQLFQEIDIAFNLLNEKQKLLVNEWLTKKSMHLSNVLRILSKKHKDLEAKFLEYAKNNEKEKETLLKTFNELKNDPLENYKADLDKHIESEVSNLENNLKSTIDIHIQNKLQELSNSDSYEMNNIINENYDIQKIKRTLNIMMELFEKGMDFEAILLKAKTDFEINKNSYSLMTNSNYSLQHSNENIYLSDGIDSSKNGLFTKFNDV